MPALLMLLSQRLDPSRNESYNLIKMCKCVECFLFSWRMDELLCMVYLSSSFSLDVYYISFSLFSLWHALCACGIPSFGMHLFLIAHSINNMERMIMKQSRSFYFMDGWWIMLIPSVGILHMNMGIYVIVIIWYEKVLARISQFDKTQWNNK